MKIILYLSFTSSLLIGCTSDPDPTTIQIGAGPATVFAAFRDGVDAPWQPATRGSPAGYQAAVHGPYLVTVVCHVGNRWSTVQAGRTLDDPHDLGTLCDTATPNPEHKVTGHMVQTGQVAFEHQLVLGMGSDWEFQFSVPDGSYDLLALSANTIAVRRQIAIHDDTAVTPDVDVAAEGQPLASAAFSVANADMDEQVQASVMLSTSGAGPMEVYRGPIDQAKVVPESILAQTDNQTVEIQATVSTAMTTAERALRRPFRANGDTAFILPPSLGAVQWDVTGGQLAVTWVPRPDLGSLIASGDGASRDGVNLASCKLELSMSFLSATGARSATCATDLPGYHPEYKIDFTRQYTRQVAFQHLQDGKVATTSETETVHAMNR